MKSLQQFLAAFPHSAHPDVKLSLANYALAQLQHEFPLLVPAQMLLIAKQRAKQLLRSVNQSEQERLQSQINELKCQLQKLNQKLSQPNEQRQFLPRKQYVEEAVETIPVKTYQDVRNIVNKYEVAPKVTEFVPPFLPPQRTPFLHHLDDRQLKQLMIQHQEQQLPRREKMRKQLKLKDAEQRELKQREWVQRQIIRRQEQRQRLLQQQALRLSKEQQQLMQEANQSDSNASQKLQVQPAKPVKPRSKSRSLQKAHIKRVPQHNQIRNFRPNPRQSQEDLQSQVNQPVKQRNRESQGRIVRLSTNNHSCNIKRNYKAVESKIKQQVRKDKLNSVNSSSVEFSPYHVQYSGLQRSSQGQFSQYNYQEQSQSGVSKSSSSSNFSLFRVQGQHRK